MKRLASIIRFIDYQFLIGKERIQTGGLDTLKV
jgi:hypothetical protein